MANRARHKAANDRNDPCNFLLMSFEGSLGLPFVAVIRGDEIGADEQKNHICSVEVTVDGRSEIFPAAMRRSCQEEIKPWR